MTPITIILADDHQLVRQGLRALLAIEPDFQIVGEAADGLEVIALVEKLQPQVLVLDLMMPGLSGLEVTTQLSRKAPQTRIVMLSMHANEAYVLQALRNGAAGYVLKEAPAAVLTQAIREVAAGRRYLSAALSERAIEAYIQKAEATPLDLYDTLTAREREMLHLVAEGLSSGEIGRRLFLSPRTVETHRGSMMRKLGLHNQTDLIRYAMKRGILPMEQ
ncbi:MAG: response regulator transcription factor [Planctomycetia bacterium]|nr:response regulator transcription factor [Planctomycetia bacterium]